MAVNLASMVSILTGNLQKSLDPLDILIYSKAIEKLKLGQIFTVAGYGNLPATTDSVEGQLVFVENENTLYTFSELWSNWHPIAVDVGASIWAWGLNNYGQLGDNTAFNKSSPVSIVGRIADWCQISSFGCHNAALRANRTLWSWGLGTSGQLGNGASSNRSSPVSVIGGFTDWSQVSAGNAHTAAVRANRTLWSWGLGTSGQLGNGASSNRSSPVSVVGGFTDWCQVSASNLHTVALRTNGTLWSWGAGSIGELGDNTTTTKSSPVSVVGGFTDWGQVSVGGCHAVALRSNGSIWTWGFNNSGRLGDGTTTNRSSPVSVVGGFTDWCQVSAGSSHTAAVRTNGSLWAWGYNNQGQLGDGTTVAKFSPVSVVGGFTDWCQVSAGGNLTSAVRTNGTLWAWGLGSSGQLGDNTTVLKSSPVSVVGGFTDWCQVSAGNGHIAAIRITLY